MQLAVACYTVRDHINTSSYLSGGAFDTLWHKHVFITQVVSDCYDPSIMVELLRADPRFIVDCKVTVVGNKLRFHTDDHFVDVYDLGDIPQHHPGAMFGYPECCVSWYHNRNMISFEIERKSVWNGTGYVPCPECSQVPKEEQLKRINATRITPIPFPEGDRTVELVLAAWLMHNRVPLSDNLSIAVKKYPDFDFNKLLRL